MSTSSYSVIDDPGESDEIRVSAYPPFDDSNPGADIILRTSDGYDFYTHKLLLSLASPVFASLFTLPQGAELTEDDKHNDRPLVRLIEDSLSVHLILRVCDPRQTSTHSTLNDILLALAMADKYDMAGVKDNVVGSLLLQQHSMERESLRVFATSVRYQFEEVARKAAKETLRLTLEERPNVPELKFISGTMLQNLHEYYFACGRAASSVAMDKIWITDRNFCWFGSNACGCSRCGSIVGGMNTQVSLWWIGYMSSAADALYKRPRGVTVREPDFAGGALATGAACTQCRGLLYSDFKRFNILFSSEVEDRVNKISLVVDF